MKCVYCGKNKGGYQASYHRHCREAFENGANLQRYGYTIITEKTPKIRIHKRIKSKSLKLDRGDENNETTR